MQFFLTYQQDKEDIVKVSLYKEAKYLVSVENARISRDVKLSSKDLQKKMLQRAGGAFKKIILYISFYPR